MQQYPPELTDGSLAQLASELTGNGQGGAITGSAVLLPYSATVVTDARLGKVFDLVITGNCILANPANAGDGKKIQWRISASGADRQLSLGDKFVLPSTATTTFPVTIPSGKLIIFLAEYYQPADKWLIESYIPAYL